MSTKQHIGKAEFIDAVKASLESKGESVTRVALTSAIEESFSQIIALIKTGTELRIKGFGTFSKKMLAPRSGTNPLTGKPMKLDARAKIGFKMAASVKDEIQ